MKKIISWLLAMLLVIGCLPAETVWAVSAGDTPAYIVSESAANPDPIGADNEQLLDGYIFQLFYGAATFGRLAGDRLTGDEKRIYDALVPVIKQIAAGERSNTVIGLGETVSYGGENYVADAAVAFTSASLSNASLGRILSALLTDMPYEMFWYDKTSGAGVQTLRSDVIVHLRISFSVADNYQGNSEFSVDCATARAAAAAAQNSAAIVSKYAARSDYEKLLGYKDEICSLVEYDDNAAGSGTFAHDNDPWQLIHVFDGDSSTNVVCEGYAKAFMYLCDQTAFTGDVTCITVSGWIGSGGHMWNIVTLDGENYLVDVTNSEVGTVGQNGELFLAGGSGSVAGSYTVGGQYFTYSSNELALWGSDADSILTLAAENYEPNQQTWVANGTCGDNLTWTLDDAGTLTISGTGPMDDFSECGAPWYDHRKKISSVVLSEGVTVIGGSAFEGMEYLTDITIPDSVTTIELFAFYDCKNLTSITIPDSVTVIGESAFEDCENLKWNIYDNAKYLGNEQNPYFALIAASSTEITSCQIHDKTVMIADYAFAHCFELTEIVIPDSVIIIGNFVFYFGENLASVKIGRGVSAIGNEAFLNCNNLVDIWVDAQNATCCTDEYGVLFGEDKTVLIKAPCCLTGHYYIPEGVATIADHAFQAVTGLNEVTVPSSVTTIGRYAFFACFSLTNITIPDSVTTIDSFAFINCHKLNYNIYDNAKYLGNEQNPYVILFSATSTDITSCQVHPNTRLIGGGAFTDCTSLTSIVIPNGATINNNWVFYNCTSLTSITLGSNITAIGKYVFYNCPSLTDVYYNGTEEQWKQIAIDEGNEDLRNAAVHFMETPVDFIYGDANGDGIVNGMDVLRLLSYQADFDYETGTSPVEVFPGADANGDGLIDGADVLRLKRYFANLNYETGESTVPLGPQ